MFHTSSILVKVQRQITAFTIKMQSEADKEQSVLKNLFSATLIKLKSYLQLVLVELYV